MERGKKAVKSQKATIVLAVIGVVLLVGIICVKWQQYRSEVHAYQLGEKILSYDSLQNHYIGTNGDQVFLVTEDGISAYNIKGQELWRDTLSLHGIEVVQKGRYFAVGSKQGKKLTIFGEKGKTGEVTTQYPILFFSINEKGDVVIVEEMDAGHVVSAYASRGTSLGVKRITYTDTAGFPVAVELSPKSDQLLISYVNLGGPSIISDIVAIDVQKEVSETRDDLLYGLQEKGNLVFQIQFLSPTEWVAIGDRSTTFYTALGDKINQIDDLYPRYVPYLMQLSKSAAYIPMVITDNDPLNAVHKNEKAVFFNEKGESLAGVDLKEEVTYYYAGEKGIIIGQGRYYTGYNKLGVMQMRFQGAQDIKKVLPIGNRYIAITKDEVYTLKTYGIEEEV